MASHMIFRNRQATKRERSADRSWHLSESVFLAKAGPTRFVSG
jgi:hypothetical protein